MPGLTSNFRFELLAAGLLLLPVLAQARVYSLRPGSGARDVQKILAPKKIRKETVTVNGARGSLEIGYSDKSVADLLAALRTVLAESEHREGESSMLIDIPGRERLVRYYIFSAGADQKTLIFHLEIPKAGLAEDPGKFWPKELPRPSAGTVEQVMKLHESQGTYATFAANGAAERVFFQYDSQLRSGGWKQLSSSGTGGAYLSADGKQMLTVSTTGGKDECFAAVYLRSVEP